jgi:hypothetical protein
MLKYVVCTVTTVFSGDRNEYQSVSHSHLSGPGSSWLPVTTVEFLSRQRKWRYSQAFACSIKLVAFLP